MEQYQPVDGDPFAASAVSLQPVSGDPFAAGSVNPQTTPQGSMPYDLQGQSIAAYNPTWREKAAQWLYGDQPRSPEAQATIRGLLGTTGLGSPGFSVSDLTPAGGAFAAQEAARRGDYSGAGIAAMSVLPGAGVIDRGVMEGAGLAERAGEGIVRQYPMAPRSEWYGDANFESTGGRMTSMTPDQYLAQARPMEIEETARENIDDLKRHIEEGKTLDPLALYENGKEDGRHRAIAAKELGIPEIPVISWRDQPSPFAGANTSLQPVTGDPFTPITAYHGSPHDFDAFDMSKIGTGEGAQAYGHGLYFAGNEKVAEQYRNQLQNGWTDPTTGSPVENVVEFVNQRFPGLTGMDKLSAQDAAEDFARGSPFQRSRSEGSQRIYDQATAALNELKPSGSMYHVQINADPNHFLDWDKPLSQQSPQVQQALATPPPGINKYEWLKAHADAMWLDPQTENQAGGVAAYRRLSTIAGGDDKLSGYLQQAGIPGIKYLDAGSRGDGPWHIIPPDQSVRGKWIVKGKSHDKAGDAFDTQEEAQAALVQKESSATRNYVVFDDKKIQILKKFGLAGLGIGTAAGLKDFQTQPVNGDPYQ